MENGIQTGKECAPSKSDHDEEKTPLTHIKGSLQHGKQLVADNRTESGEVINVKEEVNDEILKIFRLPNRSKLVLLLVCLSNICAGCSFSILAPFYPNEAAKKGMTESVTGFVFSSYQIVSFVASLMYGNYLAQIGGKFLFVSGVLIAAACSFLFGLMDKVPSGLWFIILSFLCRIMEALGVAAFVTASLAILYSEFPKHISTVFGITEANIAIGLMTGPALGGVLNEAGGFGLPFFVIGAMIFMIGCVIFFLLPPLQDITNDRKGSILIFLRSPLVWVALQSIIIVYIGMSFLEPVFSIHLEQFHLSPSLVGLMFVIIPAVYGLTTALWGYLADKKELEQVLIVVGAVGSCFAFLLIGPSPLLLFLPVSLWVIILGCLMFGLSFGAAFVAPVRCLLIGAGQLGFENNLETFGFVSGLFNASVYLGAFIGPSVSGVLVEAVGFRWATTCVAGLLCLSSIYSMTYFSYCYLRERLKNKDIRKQYETLNTTHHPMEKSHAETVRIVSAEIK